jgi:SlyX protein
MRRRCDDPRRRAAMLASPSPMEDRIVELEIKIAFQDKTLRELDEVVTAYAARLDALTRELEALRQGVDGSAEAAEIVDERPPHY